MSSTKIINITDEDICIESQCLKFVDSFFSYTAFSRENKVAEFYEAYEALLPVDTENNCIFNFFCSYIIRSSNISNESKELIKRLQSFQISRMREWKKNCQSFFEYVVENKVLINDNLIITLYKETMNNSLLNKYISILVLNKKKILNYVKYDSKIDDHIAIYCQEFFSEYFWLKTDGFDRYKYIEKFISKDEKIEYIDSVLQFERLDVIYVTKFNNVLSGLKIIEMIETNVEVKKHIKQSIMKLVDERAKIVQSSDYKDKLQTIESPIEIPNEIFELMKIVNEDFTQFMQFIYIPDFFSMPKSLIDSIVNYNVFDPSTGFIKNEISNTDFVQYMKDESCEISLSNMQMYGKLIQMATDTFMYGISTYANYDNFRSQFVTEIQNIFSSNYSEHFIYSTAGATFLVCVIEVILENVHNKLFPRKESEFDQLKDLYEADYISKDEFFYIMYVLYDENGMSLRNKLCHGNDKFCLDESCNVYIIFKILILIATLIERKEIKC